MSEQRISTVEPDPGFWPSVWEALRGSQRDFTSGSIPRAVLLLAVPMMLELVGESIFAVADAFFVSRLGAAPLAAVGLTESLMALVYSIAIGLSMATTALVARRWGEGRRADAGRAAAQAIVLGVFVSLALGLAGALSAPRLLPRLPMTTTTRQQRQRNEAPRRYCDLLPHPQLCNRKFLI